MTNEEIDKWVEDHMKWESDSEYSDLFIKIVQWSKDIAHKFYELGRQGKGWTKEDEDMFISVNMWLDECYQDVVAKDKAWLESIKERLQ